MEGIEFEVEDIVPPRNVGKRSMWSNKTEIDRIVELRKQALIYFKGNKPFSKDIRLEVEIHIPRNYNKPGDLDNFIKGICDSLSIPHKTLANPNFKLHEEFKKPENRNIHPEKFEIIVDDEQITEIKAKKIIGDYKEPHYYIKINGN